METDICLENDNFKHETINTHEDQHRENIIIFISPNNDPCNEQYYDLEQEYNHKLRITPNNDEFINTLSNEHNHNYENVVTPNCEQLPTSNNKYEHMIAPNYEERSAQNGNQEQIVNRNVQETDTTSDEQNHKQIIDFNDKIHEHIVVDYNNEQDTNMEAAGGEEEEETDYYNYDDDDDVLEPVIDVYDSYFSDNSTDSDKPATASNFRDHVIFDQNPDLTVTYLYTLARCEGRESIMRYVTESIDINIKDSRGKTALTYAKEDKHNAAIEELLACGAEHIAAEHSMNGEQSDATTSEDVTENVAADDDFLFRQLYCAAMVENGQDIIDQLDYPIDYRNKHGDTVLTVLAREGNFNGVLNMLEAGAWVNNAAILAAEASEKIEILQLLCTYQDKQSFSWRPRRKF